MFSLDDDNDYNDDDDNDNDNDDDNDNDVADDVFFYRPGRG